MARCAADHSTHTIRFARHCLFADVFSKEIDQFRDRRKVANDQLAVDPRYGSKELMGRCFTGYSTPLIHAQPIVYRVNPRTRFYKRMLGFQEIARPDCRASTRRRTVHIGVHT